MVNRVTILSRIIAAYFVISLTTGSYAATAEPSLCHKDEQIFFSCPISGSANRVSLCGSNALDHRRGYLQYRFGRPGAVELQFPRDRANTQGAFRYTHYFRPQVDRSEISFDNGGYQYIVFSYYEGDVKPAINTAGVRITKHRDSRPSVELHCRAPLVHRLGLLANIIPRDPDNPLNR